MVRTTFAAFLVLHALIHFLGFAKASGLAELPQLHQPISRAAGLGWLAASVLLLATAVTLFAWPRAFWMVGAAALVVSQAVIVTSWHDAKFGTFASLLLLVGVSYGVLSRGPWSFSAAFDRDVSAGMARRVPQPPVTEADLAPLPPPVQRYLRFTGSVGQPRVQAVRARFGGFLQGGRGEPWMPMTARQVSFFDEPARFFLVSATQAGIPFEAFHRFVGPSATFAVKVASLVTVTDAKGPEMDRSETVTHFNDMVLLAPPTLVSPAIRWEAVDDRTARATFTRGAVTIRAELEFDGEGRVTGFRSDDRSMASKDGSSFRKARWSTPVHEYRAFGAHRLASRGEAVWDLPDGPHEYARFEFPDVEFNPAR